MVSLLWGSVAGSAVLLGALVSMWVKVNKVYIGWIMAFGTGVLIGAATLELVQESVESGGLTVVIIGVLVGASVFTIADSIIHKKGGGKRKQSRPKTSTPSGLAIFIGTILDVIPESIIIGTGLLEGTGVSLIMISAIFISNFPEGLSSTSGLIKDGYSKGKIIFLWSVVFVLTALGSFFGYTFLSGSSPQTLAFISSFAAGAIIAMVSSTMMPEAYEEGGPIVGLVTVCGLLTALSLRHFA